MSGATGDVVALGGGGWSDGEQDAPLDRFVVGLTGKPRPRIAFLPTASGDSDRYLARFYQAFPAESCIPSHLALFERTVVDLRAYLLGQDLVYVGGGNTANLLAVWRTHGVDDLLREAWARGVLLAGVSAGALCWFECGVTDSFGKDLAPLDDGLGLLAGSFCPHFDAEPRRRPTYRRLVAEGFPGGIAADDGVAVHYRGTTLAEVVSARPGAHAYRIERRDGDVSESRIEPRLLENEG